MHQPALVAVADACAAPADAATRYRRRRPENTALYRVVEDHLESFLAEARDRTAADRRRPGTSRPSLFDECFPA